MKKHEIVVGGKYIAKVAGKLTTVRVDAIREVDGLGFYLSTVQTRYDVTNLTTNRKTTFRSAAKFRCEAKPKQPTNVEEVTGRVLAGEKGLRVQAIENKYSTEQGATEAERQEAQVIVTKHYPGTATPLAKSIIGPIVDKMIEQGTLPAPVDTFTLDEEGNEVPTVDQTTTVSREVKEAVHVPVNTGPRMNLGHDHGVDYVPAPRPTLASKLATIPTKTKHPLTDEQQAIVTTAPKEQVLVIEAGAGTGKTSTLVELSNTMGGRGQYTAFNTKLVDDSKQKFPSRCPCNTIHSLAFRSEGYKFKHRMNQSRVRSSEVAAILGVQPITAIGADGLPKVLQPGFLVSQVTKAVKRFCQSADREIGIEHFGYTTGLTNGASDDVKLQLLPYAIAMWNDVSTPKGRLPYQHDFYVKVWQLNTPIISADYVLLDEAQDTSPVMLDVLAQQVKRGTQVFLVGDSAQQIYSWRGAVNALAAFPEAKRLMLSQSFRFGQVVAEVANAVLSHLNERTPLVMKGFDKINSRLDRINEPKAILCRTNAAAVQAVLDGIANGKRPNLIGGGDDVLAFVNAAKMLQQGRRTEHPELACFESWREVQAFVKTDEGEDLKLMVKLIDTFTAEKIADALNNMPSEKDADFVVSTAHKSKGREWHSVKLASDFMPLSKMGDEELRLLYVAATRAQHMLDVETCPPFCGGEKRANETWNGEGGREEVIDISEARKLSKELPSERAAIDYVNEVEQTNLEKNPDHYGTSNPNAVIDNIAKRSPMDNTWSKGKDGEWLVRGRPGQKGKITVYRLDKSSSVVTVAKVIWEDDEVALYAVSR